MLFVLMTGRAGDAAAGLAKNKYPNTNGDSSADKNRFLRIPEGVSITNFVSQTGQRQVLTLITLIRRQWNILLF